MLGRVLITLGGFVAAIFATSAMSGRAALAAEFCTRPTLVNPVNPMNFGAKCDGRTDDTAAFQAAVNASDVFIPAQKICVINSRVTISVSNRHIECGAGTTLQQTIVPVSQYMFNFTGHGNRITGDSIVNCNFLGTNTVPPQADWKNEAKHYNTPIATQDKVDNFLLACNTFDRFWGQAQFQTYGGVDGGTGDVIEYNTFKNCAYYGPVLVAHTNGYIGHNTLQDCAVGIENDDAGQLTGRNVIEYNTLTCVNGYGTADMAACTMLTGGGNAWNYSTNIVRNNTVSGTGRGKPSVIYQEAGSPAQYSNNICGTGCRVVR